MTEEQIRLKQDSNTGTPPKCKGTKSVNITNRLSLIFPVQNVEVPEEIDDEERFLHEERSWNLKEEEFSIEKVRQEHMHKYKGSWSWMYFVEFMIYHIVTIILFQSFFIILGPFMLLIFGMKPGFVLMRNMQFWGNVKGFYMQLFLWMAQAIGAIGYFVWSDSVITFTEVAFLWYGLAIRCVVISAKYATFSDNLISMYKKCILPDEIFSFDLMMQDWRLQTPKILFLEPFRSMKRYQFEISLFKFDFIVPLHKETIQKVNKIEIDYYQDVRMQLLNSQYSGFQIFGYLVGEYQQKNNPNRHLLYSMIEALLISMSPILLRIDVFYYNTPSKFDILRLSLNAISLFLAVSQTNIFFHQAFYDFNRKFFLLEQALYMIKSTPEKYSSTKLLPTINFNNPAALQAWCMFRALCFDYGQTYNFRTQGFYSLIFLGFMSIIVTALLLILEFLTFDFFQMILLGEVGLAVVGFTLYYLFMGAKLNVYNEQCEIALQDLKSVYLDILRMKEVYFIENVEPQNYIHKKFKILLTSQCANNIVIIEHLIKSILAELDDNIRIIQFDQRNNPFKLYGVKITFNLLKSAGVGLSTLFSYALQQRFMAVPK